ncbi:MAG: manganese catalase family protein [Peptococcaceae bacterium]|nr:manganese catalase family protein [Peptococcaceae bacterium]
MFKHFKDMEYTVHVDRPDPVYAIKLLEQFGGGNGELKAAMQYFCQSLGTNDPKIRDLMQDIAAEELSHFEMVGECIAMLLGNTSEVPKDYPAPSMALLGGPLLTDSNGIPWNGYYVNSMGDMYSDLRSNVAAELRAKIIYERLLQQTDDPGVKDMIRFLLSREESHSVSFTEALSTLQGQEVMLDFRDSEFSKQYMDLSTGQGNATGPWNTGNDFKIETDPQKKYGGMPSYGKDRQADNPREFGPGMNDHTRNNPNLTQH